MVFVFLFLTYFTQDESLVPSMLLQMALFCPFLWLSSSPLCICTTFPFLIHSSASGHLGCFVGVVGGWGAGGLFFFFFFFFFCFLGLHPRHMKVPRLGVQSELQLPVYTTATATPDPSLQPTSQLMATP